MVPDLCSPDPSSRVSGDNVKIQLARQNASVQSKIFPNGSLNPVSNDGLPDFFRDGNSKARMQNAVFPGNNYKIVTVMTFPFLEQEPVLRGCSYSIRLGKR